MVSFVENAGGESGLDFAKEKGQDVVVVNPGTVMGDVISPRLNASMLMLVRLLEGNCFLHNFVYDDSVGFRH